MGTINEDETRMIQVTRQNAGNLVALARVPGATGLSWGEALAAITSRPAEVMGLGGEIGSLRAGRRADIVIWDGDPLDTSSIAQMVMIDGVQQPLDTRQTKLRDRYRTATEGQLPKAYEH
jgi:imidazolonepropionase-like amidohydrolase